MSEFKYACPVCGQHIKCDSSQAGTVMDCPTCFQKIIVPQAPASGDQKLILTGTQLTERKMSATASSGPATPAKKFPVATLVIFLLVLGAIAATVVIFHGKIFKTSGPETSGADAGKKLKHLPPALVAPPANDTNWTLTLTDSIIPPGPVVGRIHGQDFIVEHASFQNGSLTLRAATRGPVKFGCTINFAGAQPEILAGKNLNILADTNKSARVTLHWEDAGGAAQKENYEEDYALRLEFGKVEKNHLPGKIYLCLPDAEKSYLMGTFNAFVSKPKPKK